MSIETFLLFYGKCKNILFFMSNGSIEISCVVIVHYYHNNQYFKKESAESIDGKKKNIEEVAKRKR